MGTKPSEPFFRGFLSSNGCWAPPLERKNSSPLGKISEYTPEFNRRCSGRLLSSFFNFLILKSLKPHIVDLEFLNKTGWVKKRIGLFSKTKMYAGSWFLWNIKNFFCEKLCFLPKSIKNAIYCWKNLLTVNKSFMFFVSYVH